MSDEVITLTDTAINFAATCACFNIRKASRALTGLYDAVLRPASLRSTQATLLMAIAAAETPTISLLAERLVMDRTTLGRDLKPLVAQGLAHHPRRGSPDPPAGIDGGRPDQAT